MVPIHNRLSRVGSETVEDIVSALFPRPPNSSNDNPLPRKAKRARRPNSTQDNQLELTFGCDGNYSVEIQSLESLHGSQLKQTIADLKPRYVLDFRHFSRFDLPGTNRSDLFIMMDRVGATYVATPIPWHLCNIARYQNTSTDVVKNILEQVSKIAGRGPALILTQKTVHANFVSLILRDTMKSDPVMTSDHV